MTTAQPVPYGVTVNGTDYEFATAVSVRTLLSELDLPHKGVAIAVDGAVLPKAQWDEPIRRGWQIEVLTAVQGG